MTRRNRRPAATNPDLMAVLGLAAPEPELVDAARTREHVARLLAAGWGSRSIARRSGVDRRAVRALWAGRSAGLPPTRRVHAGTQESILAIRPDDPKPDPDGQRDREPGASFSLGS
ncbi:hypothetical protein KGD82_16715 [Nocardiopsis eucommiae]|uniref:Uncharacterized protein n=1 Tax=Nocardiopsis eucommiae TaxID=2831970 RepID=A0A975L832_9ACTN|nr:hypothetical protein KGD82_16715 [Nocardiopsis eucommiae]